jgi:hypothetical protein
MPIDANSIKVETLNPRESRKNLSRKELLHLININKDTDWDVMFKREIIGKLKPDLAMEVACLVKEVLTLCDGSPLALKLMGCFLAYDNNGGGKNVEAWQHVVKSMKEATPVVGEKDDQLYAKA